MKPHGTATENLADVLQALQLARKTGLLVVERYGANNEVEQGNILLHNGQIIDANIGPYRKAVAMDIFMRWGQCYFVLQPLATTKTAPAAPASPPPQQALTRIPMSNGHRSNPGGPVQVIPYHVRQADEVLPYFTSTGLSRVHRQLFLLIDGRRPALELTRLMGRTPHEIQTLLTDLARVGLIGY